MILDEWPAQELFQCISGVASATDWPKKWTDAGGKLFAGKMIALKDDTIWCRVSKFGLPYPPFDEFDLMAVRYVNRSEAQRLGLILRSGQVQPQRRSWNEDKKQIRR